MRQQFEAIEKVGGRIILMASRALAKLGKNAEDYGRVYDRILSQSAQPVIIHWLGDMFDPALAELPGHAEPRHRDGYRGGRHQPQRRPRSTASRCRCSMRSARSTCVAVSAQGEDVYRR